MVIMGIDYGDARTGVAVCDKLQFLASPVEVVKGDYAPKIIRRILILAEERGVQKFVVGLPVNMDGTEGERAEKCREFASILKSESGLEVDMFDERLTTVEAHDILSNVNVRGKKRKNVVDAVAAVIILEDYLKSLKTC